MLLPLDLPELRPGSAWLVGAGPGDPGLLTIHAANALRQADVILYDALVGPKILSLASPETRLEATGKRGHQSSMPQPEITKRLIALAQQGLRVVRLKGGDPFVFGRGCEEALALVQLGIPVSIVPGITSGIAALTAAGVPVTARETNSAVTFATGHFAEGEVDRINWEAFAVTGQPLVLYMAMRPLGSIIERLRKGGLSPQTPVAVISNATTPAQRVLDTVLSRAERDCTTAAVGAPAIVAIGGNVGLRCSLIGGIVPLVPSESDLPRKQRV
jgi:uroporphyrin-III C-methyltransferase